MVEIYNISIPQEQNPILADLYYSEQNNQKLILFCHGFKGFKDWGAWHLVAREFAKAGFVFIKFNFSHNGVGQAGLQEFTRLDLFFDNNYSRELADLELVLDWTKKDELFHGLNIKEVYVIGHSRGGGIALQAAGNTKQISKLATWASISNFDRFGDEETRTVWKAEGSRNFYNSRTKQDMKIGIQFLDDYLANQANLDLEKAVRQLNKPQLIIHGKNDAAVGYSSALRLKKWNPNAELVLIKGANHVFGAKHPYNEEDLPAQLKEVVDKTIGFFS